MFGLLTIFLHFPLSPNSLSVDPITPLAQTLHSCSTTQSSLCSLRHSLLPLIPLNRLSIMSNFDLFFQSSNLDPSHVTLFFALLLLSSTVHPTLSLLSPSITSKSLPTNSTAPSSLPIPPPPLRLLPALQLKKPRTWEQMIT